MDDLPDRLSAEAHQWRDQAHPLAAGTGQEDLGTTQDKRIRRVQGGLQGLALRGREWPHVQWFGTHTVHYRTLHTKPTGKALGSSIITQSERRSVTYESDSNPRDGVGGEHARAAQ